MIFDSLLLRDFGLFQGAHEISLSPTSRRPILLFGGKNGAGKTTVLEAIRLCLYGPLALGTAITRESYLSFLDSRIHSNPNALIQPSFGSVGLAFRYAEPDGIHAYAVTRSWQRKGAGRVLEELEIRRDGQPLSDVGPEQWQDFVRDLVPPGVSQLFFFDGEKIKHLAEDSSDQETLATAIKSLLGLDLVERLEADLGTYHSRLLKESRNGDSTNELASAEVAITQLAKELEAARQKRLDIGAHIESLRGAIVKLEGRVAAEGGGYAKSRERLIARRTELRVRIENCEATLRQMAAALLPFALAPALCASLREQLQTEEDEIRHKAGLRQYESTVGEVLRLLNQPDFWNELVDISHDSRRLIVEGLETQFRQPLKRLDGQSVDLVHNLASAEQQQLAGWLSQATGSLTDLAREAGGEIERLYRELGKVEKDVRKIPGDDVLRPLAEELNSLNQRLGEALRELKVLDEGIHDLETKITAHERRARQLRETLASQAKEGSKVQKVPRVQRALEDYRTELIGRKIQQLEREFATCFRLLLRKKDTLQRVSVNPRDFSALLFDKRDRAIPKASLSAGEKQIYAISMLWALARTSGRPLPIIIDTPLGRLDSDHRRLLVQNYFPHASHQTVILSTDTEVDQPYFEELRPWTSKAYLLDFDPAEHSTKVTAGYFWGKVDEAHEGPPH